jgi:hypothetical protein
VDIAKDFVKVELNDTALVWLDRADVDLIAVFENREDELKETLKDLLSHYIILLSECTAEDPNKLEEVIKVREVLNKD